MRQVIYDNDGLLVFKDVLKYYVRYDSGAHQAVIREDEISQAEAELVMSGAAEATQVLFSLQRRLIMAGVDPYVSNISEI